MNKEEIIELLEKYKTGQIEKEAILEK